MERVIAIVNTSFTMKFQLRLQQTVLSGLFLLFYFIWTASIVCVMYKKGHYFC